jgi:tRNA(fMet)-specific endonuclease VapC
VTRYLLDTNIVSDLVKNPGGRAAARVSDVGDRNVVTSIIVAAEIRFGLAKRPSASLLAQTEAVLGGLAILPFEQPAEEAYGALRADLESRGRPIGANDMFIAAHALALRCTLVTDNVREFSHVRSLVIENWLR